MQDATTNALGTDRTIAAQHRRTTRATQIAGLTYGALAVLGWSIFNVSTKASIAHGFTPDDLTLLRFGIAGLFSLPLLCRAGIFTAGGLGWKRAFILTLCAGPLFGQLVNLAMPFTPLAHAAIMVPPVALILGAIALNNRPGLLEIAAVTVALIGFAGALGFPSRHQTNSP